MPSIESIYPRRSEGLSSAGIGKPNALDLLAALDSIPLTGREMFERDCLSFTFDCWRSARPGQAEPEEVMISSSDVLADIHDIRVLASAYPDEISEVDAELLDAALAIEAYVLARKDLPQ